MKDGRASPWGEWTRRAKVEADAHSLVWCVNGLFCGFVADPARHKGNPCCGVDPLGDSARFSGRLTDLGGCPDSAHDLYRKVSRTENKRITNLIITVYGFEFVVAPHEARGVPINSPGLRHVPPASIGGDAGPSAALFFCGREGPRPPPYSQDLFNRPLILTPHGPDQPGGRRTMGVNPLGT
jgi:hypothetical protein